MTDTTDKSTEFTGHRLHSKRALLAALSLLLIVGAVTSAIAGAQWRRERLQAQLLTALPDAAGANPQLRQVAVQMAEPLYAHYCASCHGADLRGEPALGAPNLRDQVWLFGDGSVYEIERTLLYGVRSGLDKSRNIADMPAFGSSGMLSDAEIRSVLQYVLQLSGRPYQPVAAYDGKLIFTGKGMCFDCHGFDGRGNTDYGAPDLTANVWNSGNDAEALYRAIYFGEHRRMPAWLGTLTLLQIRSLAVYVHAMAAPLDDRPLEDRSTRKSTPADQSTYSGDRE
jgi:cytochrome c oxidase cbb3-type subunit 3